MRTTAVNRQPITNWLSLNDIPLSQSLRWLVGLTVVGAVLRLYLLGEKSIWLDEAFSIVISQRDLGTLFDLVVQADAHPPLYYIVLRFWLFLGESEGFIRLLSSLFSIASIPMMYGVASLLYDDAQAGLIGATILTFSPFHIWYAQEARMYAMLTFFVLASAYFLIRALRYGSRENWTGFVLTTTLALYTDNGAIWYVVSIALFFFFFRKYFPDRTHNWFISQLAILMLYAPWLPSLLKQTRQVTESFWLPPPTFQTVLGAFLDFNSFNFPWMAFTVLYLTVILVWAYIVPDQSWQRPLVTMWLFIPLIISLLVSLRQPIFLSRNLIAASLGYYLLMVGTIKRFGSPRATAVFLLSLLTMNLISIGHNTWQENKEEWRALTAHVAAMAQNRKGGIVVFIPAYTEIPFSYYYRQYDVALETQGYPEDEILLHPEPGLVENLADLLAGKPHIWLVLRDVETVDPEGQVKDWLDNNGYIREAGFAGDGISVLTYTRWDLLRDSLPPPSTISARREWETFLPLTFGDKME